MIRFTRIVVGSTIVLSSFAALFGSRHAKAQEPTIQPFTASEISTNTLHPDDGRVAPPFPHVTQRVVAVRSDGSVARLIPWRYSTNDLYTREVDDAATKRSFTADDVTRSLVDTEFHEAIDIVHPAAACEGTPAGQIQGFDVTYKEEVANPGSYAGTNFSNVRKKWLAPKLGCYAIKNELVHFHGSNAVEDSVKELANIRLGEPDPQYFAVPANYATRTKEAFWALFTAAIAKGRETVNAQ
jgi:hypothetical protein